METDNGGQVQPKKRELTQLDELQRAIQTAQFKALSHTKHCAERAATPGAQGDMAVLSWRIGGEGHKTDPSE